MRMYCWGALFMSAWHVVRVTNDVLRSCVWLWWRARRRAWDVFLSSLLPRFWIRIKFHTDCRWSVAIVSVVDFQRFFSVASPDSAIRGRVLALRWQIYFPPPSWILMISVTGTWRPAKLRVVVRLILFEYSALFSFWSIFVDGWFCSWFGSWPLWFYRWECTYSSWSVQKARKLCTKYWLVKYLSVLGPDSRPLKDPRLIKNTTIQ